MTDKPISQVQKGLIIALIIVVLSTAFYFMGLSTKGPSQYVLYAILLLGVLWACNSFAKERNGHITFGNIFGYGFKTSAIVACIMVAYSLLFINIFPDVKTKALEEMRIEMEKNPAITDEQVDIVVNGTEEYFVIINIAGALFGYMFMGVIASLIAAGVVKKNPNSVPFPEQQ